jgi:putative redox protein
VTILRRGRHDVRGCTVKLHAERATTDPKVFTRVHMHFVVSGHQLTDDAVARAVALSHEKYCSATAMLVKTAQVTTSFEIAAAST